MTDFIEIQNPSLKLVYDLIVVSKQEIGLLDANFNKKKSQITINNLKEFKSIKSKKRSTNLNLTQSLQNADQLYVFSKVKNVITNLTLSPK